MYHRLSFLTYAPLRYLAMYYVEEVRKYSSTFLNTFCSTVKDETDVGKFEEELRKMLMKCSRVEMSFEMICS